MKVHMQPSELREQGRNAYPDCVNPYGWREDRCAYVNWQEGFTQSKYAADWAAAHAMKLEVGKHYRTADGVLHGPLFISKEYPDRFTDEMGNWYGDDGHYWQQPSGCPFSLVAPVQSGDRAAL